VYECTPQEGMTSEGCIWQRPNLLQWLWYMTASDLRFDRSIGIKACAPKFNSLSLSLYFRWLTNSKR